MKLMEQTITNMVVVATNLVFSSFCVASTTTYNVIMVHSFQLHNDLETDNSYSTNLSS